MLSSSIRSGLSSGMSDVNMRVDDGGGWEENIAGELVVN